MSISAFQEKIKKGGCAQIVLAASALTLFVSMFYSCNRATQAPTKREMGEVAIQVGPVAVYSGELVEAIQQSQKQFGGAEDPTPAMEAQAAYMGMRQVINSAATAAVLDAQKINVTDDMLVKGLEQTLEMELMQTRLQLMMSQKLKPDATADDFDKALKMEMGQTSAELKKNSIENFKKKLSEPGTKEAALKSFARTILVDALATKTKISDEDLKKSYQDLTVKRVFIDAKTPDADKKAEEALAQVKAGTPFETVMDKFTQDPASPGKKLSESTTVLSQRTVDTDDTYKGLRGLGNGQVSGLIKLKNGTAVYKIVGVATNLPKDFDKQKETFRKNIAQSDAQTQVSKLVEEQTAKAEWKDKSAKTLFDYQQLISDPKFTGNPKSQEDALKKIANEAKLLRSGSKSAKGTERLAILAWYLAVQQLYTTPGFDKATVTEDKVAATLAVLEQTENQAMRIELVELFTQQKKFDDAANQLVMAMNALRKYDTAGEVTFRDLSARFLKVKTEGSLKEDLVKQFETAQTKWKEDKVIEDKYTAEAKAQEEQRKKEEAEAQKKADEEAKKKGEKPASDKPATTGGASTPSTPSLPGLPGSSPAPLGGK